MQRSELRLRRTVLRRVHRVLLRDHRSQRVSAGNGRGRLVEGRRLAVVQRTALLHRLQRDLPLRRWPDLRRQLLQLSVGVRLRQPELQQPQGGMHGIPVRAVQPAAPDGGPHRVSSGLVRRRGARGGELRPHAGRRQLDRQSQPTLSAERRDPGGRRGTRNGSGLRGQPERPHERLHPRPLGRRPSVRRGEARRRTSRTGPDSTSRGAS